MRLTVELLKMLYRSFVICIIIFLVNPVFSRNEPQCSSRFDYEYKVVQKLVDLENSRIQQDKTIEELMKKNSDLETEIENIRSVSKETIATLRSEFKETVDGLKVDANALKSRDDNLDNSFKDKVPKFFYGFSAYESASRDINSGNTVVFGQSRLNEGSVYNSGTGHFTAPVDGIYIFHSTLCTNSGNRCIYATFMAGDEAVGKFVANDKDWDTCDSGTALVRLRQGTTVYLKVTHVCVGTELRDGSSHMNSFSGFLVGM